ncbi:Caleosin [Moelleriella libera RCEF 2490]|uniref:Caleosin n=1 Tax=Moelleriella libera RCEF 2490 TaxID=1081109 RepID=A0A166UBU3_9HYPO|nr:Caleosin [Moelleriella libera RCEF 2490]
MEQSGARDGADSVQRAKVEDLVRTAIVDVPVTVQRRPFLQPEDDQRLTHVGTPRVNTAATREHPQGTVRDGWAKEHQHQTHGSDTGAYDNEGRFLPQKFEDVFSKYNEGQDYLTIWNIWDLLKGQRLVADPVGWAGAFFEWCATYYMVWPEDGKLRKEDIRRLYDGSLFYDLADRRKTSKT